MTSETAAVGQGGASSSQCWCCGNQVPPDKTVRLGNHPEVGVCIRCAHSLSKWAWELEDRDNTSPAARARNALRSVRVGVVRRGWHRNRLVGRYLRWLGRHTP